MIDLVDKINLLKEIPRMGWLEAGIGLSEVEDVAQHSFITSVVTLLLSDRVEEEIDCERALRMAVVHDWGESLMGDFSERLTSLIGKEAKESMEEKALEKLLSESSTDKETYLELWREYSENESMEARLVYVADRLSILIEAGHLFEKGESSEKLRRIWKSVRDELKTYREDFPLLEDLLQDLDKNYPSDV